MSRAGRLEGRVAVVTGAAQGIGRAVAERFAAEGAAIALLDANGTAAQQAAEELRGTGARTIGVKADVSDEAGVASAIKAVAADLGPVDVLANVAGIYGHHAPLRDQTIENWQRVLAVNLTGTFLCARAVLAGMVERRWGRILNVSSGHALRGRPNVSPYSVSKAGVIGFTKALALEMAPHGVTVNVILPAVTDTAMPRQYASEERMQEQARRNPMGRIGHPRDIASALAFLASDDAEYITGQTLAVNGGLIQLP